MNVDVECSPARRPRAQGARGRDQPRRQGRQGRPAVLVHRAGRDRRRGRPRRRRLRQGPRGPARDLEGRRRREEEPVHRPEARHDDHPRDRRPRSTPRASCCGLRAREPASSPAAASAPSSSSAGIRDILAKSLGTTNPINMLKATVTACRASAAPRTWPDSRHDDRQVLPSPPKRRGKRPPRRSLPWKRPLRRSYRREEATEETRQ